MFRGKQHIHTIHICISKALHIAMAQRPYGALRGAIEWIVVWYPPVISAGIGIRLQVETQYLSFISSHHLRIDRPGAIIKLTTAHITHTIKKVWRTTHRGYDHTTGVVVVTAGNSIH